MRRRARWPVVAALVGVGAGMGVSAGPGEGVARADEGRVVGVDAIAAVVAGVPITTRQLRRHAAPLLHDLEVRLAPGPDRDEAVRKALAADLEAAIDDRLFSDEAARAHLVVEQKEIDDTVRKVAEGQQMTPEQLVEAAASQGFTRAELEDAYRRQILSWRVLQIAWGQDRTGPFPADAAAVDAFRQDWLARRKREVCIERRIPGSP